MQRPEMKMDRYLLLGMAAVLTIFTMIAISFDSQREWTFYQSEFEYVIADTFGPDMVDRIEDGIQQIWVQKLDRVDRCITCHQGIFWRGFESAEQPFTTHPNLEMFVDIIGRHFKQPKEGLGFDNTAVSHQWRTLIWPTNFL